METGLAASYNWNITHKLLFRFFALYFFIYIFPFPLDLIPHSDAILQWYGKFWDIIIFFTAKSIFHISYPVQNYGDNAYQYIQVFIMLIIALVGAIIWTITDRKRKSYDLLLYWLMVYIRYWLALTLLSYASAKIFKYQFPSLGPYDLTETYGQSSPMTLLWSFMGYSYGYNLFTGIAEAAGAFLLFFRRTSTIGTLILITVLSNVVILNFCYDVYVKLYSTNLLIAAIFLIAPDAKRLWYFFFLNRAVPAVKRIPAFNKRWMRITRICFKTFLIAYIIYSRITHGLETQRQYGDKAPKSPLDGAYKVASFVLNKDTIPPLTTDSIRWNKLMITEMYGTATVELMNEGTKNYSFKLDEKIKTFSLTYYPDTTIKFLFSYQRPDSIHLFLRGKIKEDSIYIRMKKMQFELENHKIKLINNDQ